MPDLFTWGVVATFIGHAGSCYVNKSMLRNPLTSFLNSMKPMIMPIYELLIACSLLVEKCKNNIISRCQLYGASYEYDVFLSFRGDDTRETFTSTLYYVLRKVHKVKTFIDDNLKKGSKLEDLLTVVEKSRISVVVFSENFAESEWCLKELTKIFEESCQREHDVVPVFFKVNPSDLRHQNNGNTQMHMEKHHDTYGKESNTVKSWSNAIKELANLTGYTYWSGRGKQEVELAEEIALDILKRLHGGKAANFYKYLLM